MGGRRPARCARAGAGARRLIAARASAAGESKRRAYVPTPMEALAAGFVATTVVVGAVVRGPVHEFLGVIAFLGSLLGVAWVVLVRLGLSPRVARGMAGVAMTFVIYAGLPPLLDLRMADRIDVQLWAIERAVLGTTVVELLEPFASEGATALFSAIYSFHAPLFFVPALLHWRAGRVERAERLWLALALAMYVGFVGYALWPALGPVYTIEGLRPIGSNVATETVASYGVDLGTFPSLHAGICSAVAIDAWRTSRRWGVVFTAVAAAIWLSTLYLRYHWVPDLVAGLLLAAFTLWLAGRVRERWPTLGKV